MTKSALRRNVQYANLQLPFEFGKNGPTLEPSIDVFGGLELTPNQHRSVLIPSAAEGDL